MKKLMLIFLLLPYGAILHAMDDDCTSAQAYASYDVEKATDVKKPKKEKKSTEAEPTQQPRRGKKMYYAMQGTKILPVAACCGILILGTWYLASE